MLLAIAATNDSDRTSGLKLSGMRRGIRAENGLRIEMIKSYDIQKANLCCFCHEVMEWLFCVLKPSGRNREIVRICLFDKLIFFCVALFLSGRQFGLFIKIFTNFFFLTQDFSKHPRF